MDRRSAHQKLLGPRGMEASSLTDEEVASFLLRDGGEDALALELIVPGKRRSQLAHAKSLGVETGS